MVRPLTPRFLMDFLVSMRNHGIPYPARFRMSHVLYDDVRKFARDDNFEVIVDPGLIRSGFLSAWAGVQIWVDRAVPSGVLLAEDGGGNVVAHESEWTVFHRGPLAACRHSRCEELDLEHQARAVLEV